MSLPIFDWLVAWAGELVSGAAVAKDGMTAVRRLRGREWSPKLAVFGEQVLARRPGAAEPSRPSLDPRWDLATYLGTKWGAAGPAMGPSSSIRGGWRAGQA